MRLMLVAAGSVLALSAAPALAHDGGHHAGYASPHGYPAMQTPFRIDPALAARCGLHAGAYRPHEYAPAAYHDGYDRRRRGDGLGGALMGGAVGGLVGNRVAGRGDRAVGTIAGAAVGAVAGAAIDRADDRRDYAPEHDAGWDHRAADGYAGAYAGAYTGECADALPPGYTLISIPGSRECHDEVSTIEEWVPETVTIPGASYTAPERAAPLRDKRTKLRRIK